MSEICGTVAADEKCHETAYTKMVKKLFEIDPDGTIIDFEDMMHKKITMSAHLMYDGQDDNLFDHFFSYCTTTNYVDIMEFLVKRWNVEKLEGLVDEGKKVCMRRFEERAQEREG
ncbi:hypothetical protein SUGI_0950550 [Cryptomeria japonica]|nr:hypothetical protein SUGI_0950380 [Cryptomeria japonica]GLJ45156.1 hypothetical protein SUGI_0950550 [Cryptomeria japonica]